MITENTDIGTKVIAQILRNCYIEDVVGRIISMFIEDDDSVSTITIEDNDGKKHQVDLRDTPVEIIEFL